MSAVYAYARRPVQEPGTPEEFTTVQVAPTTRYPCARPARAYYWRASRVTHRLVHMPRRTPPERTGARPTRSWQRAERSQCSYGQLRVTRARARKLCQGAPSRSTHIDAGGLHFLASRAALRFRCWLCTLTVSRPVSPRGCGDCSQPAKALHGTALATGEGGDEEDRIDDGARCCLSTVCSPLFVRLAQTPAPLASPRACRAAAHRPAPTHRPLLLLFQRR